MILKRAWLLLSVLWSAFFIFTSNWTPENKPGILTFVVLPWVLGLAARWIIWGHGQEREQ